MKLNKAFLAGTAVSALLTAPAMAEPAHPWYISGAGGWNMLDDNGLGALSATVATLTGTPATTTTGTVFGSTTLPINFSDDDGFAIIGALGYRWTDMWRTEIELGYRSNDIDATVANGNYAGSGDVQALSLMLNLFADFALTDRVTFSLGGGVGLGHVRYEIPGTAFLPTTPTGTTFTFVDIDDSDTGFAYQLGAGLAVGISERTDLTLDYRYFSVPDVEISTPFGPSSEDYTAHTALIGLRYHFGGQEVAPVVTPEPEPAACAQQTFLVFFDFNKANLTADAAGVVAEAATAYKAGCSVVLVVGHTDTVGSMSYNQDLSERRAASVKAEMVNQGVPADAITTEGKSFTDPLVPTGPGVKEAQNRRAVISVQ